MRSFSRMFIAALSCALFASAASAAGLTGVEVMTSTVMQEKQSSFSGLAMRARITSPSLMQGIELLPTIEYWRNANTVEPFGIRTTRKDATLAAEVRYAFKREGMQPYVGAGFGLHFLSSTVDAPSLGLNNESDALVKGGLSATGGLSFPLAGRFENFLELKYHHVPSYRQLKLNWGLTIKV